MDLSLRARRTIIWKRIKYSWSVNKICDHFRISRQLHQSLGYLTPAEVYFMSVRDVMG